MGVVVSPEPVLDELQHGISGARLDAPIFGEEEILPIEQPEITRSSIV
jgi:hypothetical protein